MFRALRASSRKLARADEHRKPAVTGYGKRWAVESFFSRLKRTMGGALNAGKPEQMLAETAFKVIAYTLRR
jgi:hypothetical protein